MAILENSLMGNVKHNTNIWLQQAKKWSEEKYRRVILTIDRLSRDKSPKSLLQLKKIADQNRIPRTAKMDKHKLVRRLKDYISGRQPPRTYDIIGI